jgi:hypothetical protein
MRRPFLWDPCCHAPHATNPNDGAKTPLQHGLRRLPAAPIRSCSRWGLPCQHRYRHCGALLPHRFTLARGEPQAVCFLWHFPWGHPRRTLSGTVFPWSPDFPPMPKHQRPPGRLAGGHIARQAKEGQGLCPWTPLGATPRPHSTRLRTPGPESCGMGSGGCPQRGPGAEPDRVPPRGVGTALLSRVSCSIRLPWMAG